MFNNLINSRDIVDLVLKVLRFDLRWIPSLVKKRPEIARNKWNRSLEGSSNWWVIPEVKRRWNHLISGDVNSSHYEYISRKYFSNKNDLHGISLGCGSGDKELLWAATGIFSKIDAYDFSESRITRAIKQAKETNYDQIVNFQVGNVETLDLANYIQALSQLVQVAVAGSLRNIGIFKMRPPELPSESILQIIKL